MTGKHGPVQDDDASTGPTGATGAGDHEGTVVDARGLRCPLPVIRLAAVARDAGPGSVLTVLSTDPAARYDVPAWARMRGHALVSTEVAPIGAAGADDPAAGASAGSTVWAVTVRLGG